MNTAQTADYALRCLLLLDRNPLTTAALARELDLSPSASRRIVSTLRARAFAIKNADGEIVLGPGLITLAANVPDDTVTAAEPYLSELARQVDETTVLTVPAGDEGLVVMQRGNPVTSVRFEYPENFRHSLATRSAGLAILAHLPQAQQDRVIAASAAPAEVKKAIALVREQRWIQSTDEGRSYISGIAAPILHSDGSVLGSISVVASADRAEHLAASAPIVLEAARAAEKAYEEIAASAPLRRKRRSLAADKAVSA